MFHDTWLKVSAQTVNTALCTFFSCWWLLFYLHFMQAITFRTSIGLRTAEMSFSSAYFRSSAEQTPRLAHSSNHPWLLTFEKRKKTLQWVVTKRYKMELFYKHHCCISVFQRNYYFTVIQIHHSTFVQNVVMILYWMWTKYCVLWAKDIITPLLIYNTVLKR